MAAPPQPGRPLGPLRRRPIPSSADPAAWEPDLLAIYQRALLNGLRHKKPRAWETRALLGALEALVPDAGEKGSLHALDVLPCTGILTDRLARERRGYRFDVVERSPEVAAWAGKRAKPAGEAFCWTPADESGSPPEGTYDLVTLLFRLEGVRPEDRRAWMAAAARWVRPGGRVLVGFVSSARSTTGPSAPRAPRPGGVVRALARSEHRSLRGPRAARGRGPRCRRGACPAARSAARSSQEEEVAFRTRNFPALASSCLASGAVRALERVPGSRPPRRASSGPTSARPVAGGRIGGRAA